MTGIAGARIHASMTAEDHPKHRLYGRSAGKPLSARQAGLVDDLLPRIAIPEAAARQLDPRALLPAAKEIWLEIGFGGGEHLAGQAARHPDIGILGVEPFLDGVAKLLTYVDAQSLSNVRLQRGDARFVVEQLADASITRAFILFPDPWPKARHRKRRIVQPEFLAELKRVLVRGGRVRFATDWADYANRALADFIAAGFLWQAEAADDWRMPPADHVTTRYQEKRLGDVAPVFLDFVRP